MTAEDARADQTPAAEPLRVLVTGVSGVFGREITERLLRRGHSVVGLSRRPPAALPPGVRHVAADIRDPEAVARAADGCHVVAHCAWAIDAFYGDPAERAINIGGTENVLAAMERAGVGRIIFAGSNTANGPRPDNRGKLGEDEPLLPHPDMTYAVCKAEVEAMLAEAPVDAISIRAPAVVGRRIDNRVRNLLAGPAMVVVKGETCLWQVVHSDDVGRFFVHACETGPAGPVNLAPDDILTAEEVAAAIGRRIVRVRADVIHKVIPKLWDRRLSPVGIGDFEYVRFQPLLDNTRQKQEFGFECVWSGRDAIADTRLAMLGIMSIGDKAKRVPWQRSFSFGRRPADTPPLDGAPLEAGGKPDLIGEFDSPVDSRFSVFVATNFSEALPGPATPLSLTAVAPAFAKAGVAAVDFVGMTGVSELEADTRMFSIHAHRLYMNVFTGAAIGELSPGWDAESFGRQYLGRHVDELPDIDFSKLPIDKPGSVKEKARAGAGMGARLGSVLKSFRKDVSEMLAQVGRLERLVGDPAALSDAGLESMFWLAYDLQAHGWELAALGAILTGAGTNTAEQLAGRTGVVERVGEGLTSAEGLAGIRRLAERAAAEPEVLEIIDSGGDKLLERVTAVSPGFATAVREALASFGHRGPAECELASSVFADDPDLILRTVGKAARAAASGPPAGRTAAPEEAPIPRRARPAVALARWATAERERDRDAIVKTINVMRRLAREQGRRLAERGVLAAAEDVFYLTADELFGRPGDARETVLRRRAERERLAALRMPIAFIAPWEPEAEAAPARTGDVLTGVAAAGGTARGPVRVVTPDTAHLLEPGEVMVTQVTDVGYTPLFGHAAAVVTDIGGTMSHAAVVAREFG
ncbi:MAG TPA: NAD-dependent epimerase/dehydratase family protein, partial [Acidimicrobiia bacterium]|nr:NAD-dependent epimerase/dehydratase family protein [Acidimicrobiia bacterium]